MSLQALIMNGLRQVQVTKYSELASTSIIIYDHLITLQDEVDLIWKSSWSFGKVLFVLNRYYTLVAVIVNNYALFAPNITDSFCVHFFQWQGWTGLVAAMLAESILQMRLYALYFLNKKILALMVTSFIVSSVSSAAIMWTALIRISRSVTSQPLIIIPFPFCFAPDIPPYFFTFWIPILLFESLLCGLAIFRGFQEFYTDGALFRSGKEMVGVLVRDSVFYYVVMFATYLVNLLLWTLASPDFLEIPVGFSVAMSCVLCNRVILNIRQAKVRLDLESQARAAVAGGNGAGGRGRGGARPMKTAASSHYSHLPYHSYQSHHPPDRLNSKHHFRHQSGDSVQFKFVPTSAAVAAAAASSRQQLRGHGASKSESDVDPYVDGDLSGFGGARSRESVMTVGSDLGGRGVYRQLTEIEMDELRSMRAATAAETVSVGHGQYIVI